MEARFVERVGDGIKIEFENGRIFTLPLSRFSNSDQRVDSLLIKKKRLSEAEFNYHQMIPE